MNESRRHNNIFFNKTLIEVAILCALIGAIAALLFQHSFFELRDVRIEGLDAYAAARVKKALAEQRGGNRFGLSENNYSVFSVSKLQDEISAVVILDALEVTKKFPHSIIIRAQERAAVLQHKTSSGIADLDREGRVIRWYETAELNERFGQLPLLVAENNETEMMRPALGAPRVPPNVVDAAIQLVATAPRLTSSMLSSISYAGESDAAVMRAFFTSGLEVVIRTHADVTIQLRKAELSGKKYPKAKKIDARFADKVFVSF